MEIILCYPRSHNNLMRQRNNPKFSRLTHETLRLELAMNLVYIVTATSFARPSAKWKCGVPCSKIIRNFEVMTAEHETKCSALLRVGLCATAQAIHLLGWPCVYDAQLVTEVALHSRSTSAIALTFHFTGSLQNTGSLNTLPTLLCRIYSKY